MAQGTSGEFIAVVNDTDPKNDGKSYSAKITGNNHAQVLGKRIGDVVDGLFVTTESDQNLGGYKLEITGGSDKTGTPMRKDLDGGSRQSILVTRSTGFKGIKKNIKKKKGGGTEVRMKPDGLRKRRTFRGNTVTQDTRQINLKVVEHGKKNSTTSSINHLLKEIASETERLIEEREGTMSRTLPTQPIVNIGLVGHVDHGKTTLTQALSGVWTDTHSEERKRGISIKLGYADTAFYQTKEGDYYPTGRRPDGSEDVEDELQRVVSFVDAPGHETLMAIMITGASIMDGALLMVAANEPCPQPQTREHLMALEIAGIQNIVVVQNKIDLVSKERALESHQEIKEFLKGTIAENAPVIPVSAHHDVNLDVLIAAIEKYIPTPEKNLDERPLMYVARSFDINRPGTRPSKLKGGVIGGSIVEGQFKVGDEIVIGPGKKIEKGNKSTWEPIPAVISSLQGGGNSLENMHAGGLCGMATLLDPAITTSDNLSGQVVARKDELPPLHSTVKIQIHLMENMVSGNDKSAEVVQPLRNNEMLMLNVATATSVGVTRNVEKGTTSLELRLPICADVGQRVSLSRRVGSRWRLIGYGTIL